MLVHHEDLVVSLCSKHNIKHAIVRPSMIYGLVGPYSDANISQLTKIMSFSPFLFLPSQTGLRQPIHATQLASVFLSLSDNLTSSDHFFNNSSCHIYNVGGDSELTYHEMLKAIQQALPINHSARNCLFIRIPNRLFYFFASPLLFASSKLFESFLRISSNLSGFTPAHKFLGVSPRPFPII